MALNRNDILAIDDNEYKVVNIPKWGKVRIKLMSIEDQIKYSRLATNEDQKQDLLFYLIIFSCVDDEGNNLFSIDDIPLLKKKSTVAVSALFNECLAINNPDIEKEAKNS